jgi:hypothetical protein
VTRQESQCKLCAYMVVMRLILTDSVIVCSIHQCGKITSVSDTTRLLSETHSVIYGEMHGENSENSENSENAVTPMSIHSLLM